MVLISNTIELTHFMFVNEDNGNKHILKVGDLELADAQAHIQASVPKRGRR